MKIKSHSWVHSWIQQEVCDNLQHFLKIHTREENILYNVARDNIIKKIYKKSE